MSWGMDINSSLYDDVDSLKSASIVETDYITATFPETSTLTYYSYLPVGWYSDVDFFVIDINYLGNTWHVGYCTVYIEAERLRVVTQKDHGEDVDGIITIRYFKRRIEATGHGVQIYNGEEFGVMDSETPILSTVAVGTLSYKLQKGLYFFDIDEIPYAVNSVVFYKLNEGDFISNCPDSFFGYTLASNRTTVDYIVCRNFLVSDFPTPSHGISVYSSTGVEIYNSNADITPSVGGTHKATFSFSGAQSLQLLSGDSVNTSKDMWINVPLGVPYTNVYWKTGVGGLLEPDYSDIFFAGIERTTTSVRSNRMFAGAIDNAVVITGNPDTEGYITILQV